MKCIIRKDEEVNITKEDYEAYEGVRSSGVTNMFMITTVSELSGLSKDKIKAIMSNYDDLMKEFPDVRKEGK